MDSNSKHCPSRPSTDNLADDQKEPGSLPTSCATSSASPPPGSEAGSSRQPSTSCGMEEMAAAVTEAPTVGMKGSEDCVSPSSQTVDRASSGSPHRASDITLALRGSPPCVIKLSSSSSSDKHACSSTVPVPSSQIGSSGAGELRGDNDETSGLGAQAEATPRGTKRSHDEVETDSAASPVPVKQKNKKRCYKCSSKLELAQREIGRCRCDRVFCPLHRLPELHGCDFDHKEDGRREAREKMVKPTRHLGTSFRRLDHAS
ncbi:uncharacterized protein LOC143296703 [Babylonia areolata]|uniref:uncharacterized protein LOC143296703 n=1 Tax=Babylonia areolata TaxID=304850 RepID=UPI003FD41FA8